MVDKSLKLITAIMFLLSCNAHAQQSGLSTNIKNNSDGTQTLLNHVPQEVAQGLATKIASVQGSQILNLRVVLPSRDQAGLDNFVKELYDPKSPNFHKFLTAQQFNQQFGASQVESALVIEQLRSLGLTVTSQSRNGFLIKAAGPVSTIESAFKVNINSYKGLNGKTFFSPDVNPTVPLQMAGKVNAIIGMDNAPKFYKHLHRLIRLGQKNIPNPIKGVVLPSSSVASSGAKETTNAVRINGVIFSSNTKVNPQSPPSAPTGLTALPSNESVLLYWNASAGATSYNVYSASSSGGTYTMITSSGQQTTTNYTDFPETNGVAVYYKVTAVGSGESAASNIASATPNGYLGFGGSLGPSDITKVYNLSSVTSTGAGQTLGLYELDTFNPGDINSPSNVPSGCNNGSIPCWPSFETEYSLPNVTLTQVCTDEPNSNTCPPTQGPGDATDEVVLDIDLAIAVAPGLSSIRIYEAPNQDDPTNYVSTEWLDQWDTIVNDPSVPKVISVSWGSNEASVYPYDHTVFSQLASMGVTVFSAAGDSGAYDTCDTGTNPPNCTVQGTPTASPPLAVDDPASDQYVTGVGISIVAVNNPGLSSESYKSNGELASLFGGGGISSYVSIPTFQTGLTLAGGSLVSTTMRNVPDVVFNADPATYYGIYVTDPISSSGDGWFGIWGSSAAAPVWAAYMTRVNQGRESEGLSAIGYLNPTIYEIAESGDYSSTFHDITSGINNSYANFAGNDYYPAKTGYDDATGLGSFNGLGLYNELLGPAAPTGVNTTAGNGQVGLSWTAGSGDVTYNVKKSTTNGGPYTTITGSPISQTNYTSTSLTNGTPYYYVVSANNAGGVEGPNSSQATGTPAPTVPSPPTTVTAVAGNTQATVTFSGATANGSAITGYTVTSSPGGFTGTGTTSPITVTGLTNGSSYTFTVTATNAVGTSAASSPSNSVTPNIVPGAPTGVSATAGNGQATVTFTAPAPNGGTAITSYTVTSSPGGITATGTSSPITVTGLTNGTAYTFTVVAYNATGPGATSASSNSVTPAGPPTAPSTVTAVAGNTQATVTFSGATANGSAITGYTVTSSPGGFTGTGTSSPITVTGLTNGSSYTFTVTATNAVGTSSASGASNSVTPNIVPGAPTGVSAVGGNTQATVSFSAPASNGGTAVISYTVTSSPGGITATGTSSPITVTGLTNGTSYTFTVTATNAGGTGAASSPSNSVTPAGSPTAPSTVTAVAGNTQATVTFSGATANGSAITGYTVTSSPGGITATGTSSPITVTGLTNGTAYTFTVTATNAQGTSSASGASNSVTPAGPPTAPTSVSATAGNTQATVTFSGATANGSAITTYTVTSSPGGFTGTGTSSPITVTGLTNGSSYTFTVTSTNAVGTSSASTASNSVTPNIVPGAPTGVTAVRGDTQATVTFTTPAPNGGTAIISYTVTSSPGGITATGTASPITVTGLTNGTAYTFTVVAYNATGPGATSSASNSVTPAGLPVAPTSVSATPGNQQASVSFTPGSNNGSAIISYTVTSSPGGFTGTGTSSPIIVTGLTNGTSYTFTVTETNAIGTSVASSASSSVTPAGLPSAPTSVTATSGNQQASVSFTPGPNNGSAITGYTVTSSPGGFTGTGTSSPIIVTGLTNGTSYTFTVTETSAIGTSTASNPSNSVIPAGPPSAPTSVTATATNAQASVSFTPGGNNGSAITGYTVTSSPGGFTGTGTSSPITVTGLTNGSTYTFTVTETNAAGTSAASAPSNSVEPGLPAAPTSPTATRGDTQASVSFTPGANNGSSITGYTVTSSPGGITATGTSSPITVTGLTNGSTYSFTVTETNGIGTSPASAASNSITPAGLPVAPTSASATAGNQQASVSFTPGSNNGSAVIGYTVTSSPGGFTGTGTSSPITVTGLTNGTSYTFTVTETNAIGTSVASSPSNSVTPSGPPLTPTSVTATGGDTVATVSFTPGSSNGSAITGFTVTSSPGGITATGTSSPITVTGLTNGSTYTFTVTESNADGTSAASSASNSVTPAGLPVAPTTVTAVGGNMQATVSFSGQNANGSPITLYTVTSTPGNIVGTGTSSPIVVTGLTNFVSYTFTVTVANGVGTSASASAPSNSVTPSPLAAPTNLNETILAAKIGSRIIYGGAQISWTQSVSPSVTQNKIYRSTSSGPFTLIATINASNSFKDTDLTLGTSYQYNVTAYDSNGDESAPSNTVTVNY